jgi:hypothetical protein
VCCREFRQKLAGADISSRSAIDHFINKFKATGSVLDNKMERRPHIVPEEKLGSIGWCKTGAFAKQITEKTSPAS